MPDVSKAACERRLQERRVSDLRHMISVNAGRYFYLEVCQQVEAFDLDANRFDHVRVSVCVIAPAATVHAQDDADFVAYLIDYQGKAILFRGDDILRVSDSKVTIGVLANTERGA